MMNMLRNLQRSSMLIKLLTFAFGSAKLMGEVIPYCFLDCDVDSVELLRNNINNCHLKKSNHRRDLVTNTNATEV